MSRDTSVYLQDILEAISKIKSYVEGLSQKTVLGDNKTYDAILRNLEVIGEAAKHVPKEIKDANPAIDWRKIAGLRDIVIHEYFGLDSGIIWDIVKNKLPSLEEKIRKLL
ncbi:MAG: DUF86 domain-containing protein [Elusimicrobia bacterium]|nr:DUF86 domain-containing protein [Elusimicrobiota bacterium]